MALRSSRRRQRPVATVTAAATRVTLGRKSTAKVGVAKQWQTDAWGYFDEVPEAKYTIWFLGDAMSRVRFFAAAMPIDAGPDDEPVPINSDKSSLKGTAVAAAAEAEMAKLRSVIGGQPSVVRRMTQNIEVAGEFYLLGFQPRPATDTAPETSEEWVVASVTELRKKGDRFVVTDRSDGGFQNGPERELRISDPPADDDDVVLRIWQQHPQYAGDSDSHMRGVLDECAKLKQFTATMIAEAWSRMPAGVFMVAGSAGGEPLDDPEDDVEGAPPKDPFLERIMAAFTAPILDPSSADSVVPVLARGTVDEVKESKFISFARTSDGLVDRRIEQAIMRFAHGMNVPVETVLGHASTTFANATQIDADTFDDHLGPRCVFFADALATGYLRPNLGPGVPPEDLDRVLVWYDPSAVRKQPDPAANAKEMWNDGVISDAARRRYEGATEDDAPEPLEILTRIALRRGTFAGKLTAALLQSLAGEAGVELPAIQDELPGQPVQGSAEAMLLPFLAALAAGRSTVEHARVREAVETHALLAGATEGRLAVVGDRLAGIDRDLRGRLVVAANGAMARALERAGTRLRSKAIAVGLGASLKGVDALRVGQHLGRNMALQAAVSEDLFTGAWDSLETQFRAWGSRAQEQALDVAGRVASGIGTARRDTLRMSQAEDLDEAWGWLVGQLQVLAERQLFDPLGDRGLGEFDPDLTVQPGFVRRALEIAGGSDGIITSNTGGAFVSLGDGGTRPVGGIGTGELVRDALRDEGITMEAYRWEYGPAYRKRPFEPHQALDGVVFQNFDDASLMNTSGWPEFSFYIPGDHAGCVPAGTIVSGPRATGATLRHYEGQMVSVAFASGDDLSATPNHPVLTRRGWVAIGALVEGDEAVRCSDGERIPTLVPDDCQVPARIEDVTRALSMTPGVAAGAVPVAAVDFDGDGVGSEVCVVWTDGLLVNDAKAAIGKPTGEHPLSLRYEQALALTSERGTAQGIEAVRAAALGLVGSDCETLAFLWSVPVGNELLRLLASTWRDATPLEPKIDRSAVHAEALGQSVDGLAGFVEFDKVLNVEVRDFVGHVHNLTNSLNWYVADGFIVHNCVCDATPILTEVPARV